MLRSLKGLLIVNGLLLLWGLLSVTGNAQRPPQATIDGVPFLPVNINPTDVPPLVNINPNQSVPKVEVTRMPDTRFTPTPVGCDDRQNFRTAVGRTIAGPLVVTYLNLSPQSPVTLTSAESGDQRLTLGNTAQLATAIYLSAGQQLIFESDVMYSGCRPG